jgi:hypothetical protein
METNQQGAKMKTKKFAAICKCGKAIQADGEGMCWWHSDTYTTCCQCEMDWTSAKHQAAGHTCHANGGQQ